MNPRKTWTWKNTPPIETLTRFDLFVALVSPGVWCVYCGRELHWREIGMIAHTRMLGFPVLTVCLDCGFNRAAQPDCKVSVYKPTSQLYDDYREVQDLIRQTPGKSHSFCGDSLCHLCNQDLRMRGAEPGRTWE